MSDGKSKLREGQTPLRKGLAPKKPVAPKAPPPPKPRDSASSATPPKNR